MNLRRLAAPFGAATPLIVALALCVRADALPLGPEPNPSGAAIDRIEEDWEVVLATPSPEEAGPQLTTSMSPQGDSVAACMTFNLNYRDQPFTPGGLQLRAWSAGKVVGEDRRQNAQCSTTGETITWTQEMDFDPGIVTYQVKGGSSTTWGTFGQGETIRVNAPTSVASLDSYKVDDSVANSGAGWQANRVARMRLKAVRYYANGQLVSTDSTAREVINNMAP